MTTITIPMIPEMEVVKAASFDPLLTAVSDSLKYGSLQSQFALVANGWAKG